MLVFNFNYGLETWIVIKRRCLEKFLLVNKKFNCSELWCGKWRFQGFLELAEFTEVALTSHWQWQAQLSFNNDLFHSFCLNRREWSVTVTLICVCVWLQYIMVRIIEYILCCCCTAQRTCSKFNPLTLTQLWRLEFAVCTQHSHVYSVNWTKYSINFDYERENLMFTQWNWKCVSYILSIMLENYVCQLKHQTKAMHCEFALPAAIVHATWAFSFCHRRGV